MRRSILYLWCMSLPCVLLSVGWQSLSDIIAYTQYIPLSVEPDNHHVMHPEYTRLYDQLTSWTWRHWVPFFGVSASEFAQEAFKQLLVQITEDRVLGGVFDTLHIELPGQGSCVYFSQIHGNLEAMLVLLKQWRQEGLIDDQLYIVPHDTYFVCGGNQIDYGPYSLECLYIMLLLMARNPGKVLYVQGTHEKQQAWRNYSLKQELLQRMYTLLPTEAAADAVPLAHELTAFFATLPAQVYLSVPSDPDVYVRIAAT